MSDLDYVKLDHIGGGVWSWEVHFKDGMYEAGSGGSYVEAATRARRIVESYDDDIAGPLFQDFEQPDGGTGLDATPWWLRNSCARMTEAEVEEAMSNDPEWIYQRLRTLWDRIECLSRDNLSRDR